MAKGKAHTSETKAAVMAALLEGQGVNEIARDYKLPKATVSRMKSEISTEKLEQLGTQKKEQIGELIVGYLRTNLHALSVQALHTEDKAWLNKQEAGSLGTLHGIMCDKAVRILEAIEPVSEELGFGDTAGNGESVSVH
jgi:hypothetical protein